MKKKYIIIYGLVLVILLLLIMFVIPDDFFLRPYKKNATLLTTETENVEEKEFLPYEEQQKKLIDDNYNFEYILLDSMSSKTYSYKCNGTKKGNLESGTCDTPTSFSYTEENKKSKFLIDINYLDVQYILKWLKEEKYEITNYQGEKEYLYNVKIDDLETEVIVYTDYEDITRIEINNAYMNYIIKYERVI